MKTKLSSFLHTHLRNKTISKIKKHNKLARNAQSLKEPENKDKSKLPRIKEELPFCNFTSRSKNVAKQTLEVNTIEAFFDSQSTMYPVKYRSPEQIDFELSLAKVTRKLDSKTRQIVELLYVRDMPMNEVAEEVGLAEQTVRMRLKRLATRKSVQEIFDQLENV